MIEVTADLGAVLTGVGAGWIVWLGHKLSRRQRTDEWLSNLNQLHGQFWDDSDLAEVREWLASDAAYSALCDSIEIRFLNPREMSSADYRRIDLLDKFFNFLIRVLVVDSQLDADRDLWSELSFSFWLDTLTVRRRWHLLVYFEQAFVHTRLGSLVVFPTDSTEREALSKVKEHLLPTATPAQVGENLSSCERGSV
jgi:hypothetical protein